MPSQLARFTDRIAELSQEAVVGAPGPALKKGDGGYADWVIVALHCLREYLDHPYRRLFDVLQEMSGIVAKLGLSVAKLPDFTNIGLLLHIRKSGQDARYPTPEPHPIHHQELKI